MKELLSYFDDLSKETRIGCAKKYRDLILSNECGETIDWRAVNEKIIERWSFRALAFIKYHAFVRKTKSGNRTWIVCKNSELQYIVALVSVNDFWGTLRAGFSDKQSAQDHLSEIMKKQRQSDFILVFGSDKPNLP